MGIPAIFAGFINQSLHYDRNRYEFDPNKTWSVLEQGRGFETLEAADRAVQKKEVELGEIRKDLVNNVKKLDEAMLKLRSVSGSSATVAAAVPEVLERLAGVRKSVGVDGPQQLMDFTAPPVDIRGAAVAANIPPAMNNVPAPAQPNVAAPAVVAQPAAAPTNPGALPQSVVDGEIASVPEPQKKIALMLPLADIPAGWEVGKSGAKHLETFNAENLFEKIDGRAESFIQYDVKGMAYTYYHPIGDDSNEIQIYIFEMANPLKALGKYGSEKPEGAKLVPVGTEGYEAAGSTLFYAGPYYTQIVSTNNDAKFGSFALELAKKVVAKQKTNAEASGGVAFSSPDLLFNLLPAGQGRSAPKYVAQDVFGYSFLSDVFMADYKEVTKKDGKDVEVSWQGFVRPYPTPEAAKAVFDLYVSTAKKDGATIKTPTVEGADQFVIGTNTGLVDAIFRRGNTIGGANGGTDPVSTEKFATGFVKAVPASLPPIESDLKKPAGDDKKPKAEEGAEN